MNTKNFSNFKFSIVVVAAVLTLARTASAEESAYADLNACTKGEQIKLTAKGAITGAFAGFGAAFLSGKQDDAAKAAVAGAVVGGAAGFATAYYTAIKNCLKLNPTWITESNIIRDPSKSYAQVNSDNNYKPRDGIKVLVKNVEMADSVKAGSNLDIKSTFDVMTPDGAETAVVVERKLFALVDGKETSLPFPGKSSETRTVAAGRSNDSVTLPISSDAKPGSVYRVEFSVAAAGKSPAIISKTVTVG